ncbi:isoleucine--tRNA ligase [Lapidilactobacillus concavus]|nr:isoleucine--tRNA ligase [Lapidilactobacillus concavus]GEL13032.1 isoleucine--tRNA ligase [Lapidilactobacillus concavus]
MRVKDTLHLGKTEFPMRGSLPKREPEWQDQWEENKVYERRQKLNEGKPTFMLHDGPPFANGNIHLGHALNKISKDIIVRYKSMSGFRAPYVPGWDTHGLPIEQQLAKQGVDRKTMDPIEYRKLCYNYAMQEVEKQKAGFKRLGVAGDWDHPYITLQPEFEAEEVRVFGKMAEKGYIYKGKKPVYWSPSSESTLAEAEIEYHDIKSPSIYVAFKVIDGNGVLDTDTSLIIWTTTPWTIPANLAISVNPRFDYSVIKADGKKYVIATERLAEATAAIGFENYETLAHVAGKDLEFVKAKHPLYDRESVVILGDHVTLDDGTGLVHTAPGHGADDFNVGQKYHLPVYSVVNAQGYMNENAPGFEGVFYDDANKLVTDALTKAGALLKLSFFVHSYPHDWRTKKPVFFRATTQWFASIDAFRDQILAQIKQVKFSPEWGQTRLYNMIRDRGDWVISRQRAWGLPLPIFYAENGEAIITPETTEHVAELFEKYGSIVWYEKSAKELLPEGFTHPGSPNGEFTKEKDILDVWFDSGSSHQAVMAQRPELSFPADLYLEGSDQYRGWFNSSLITSVAVTGQSPYRQVVSQGFVLDDKGHKMSKSLGNVINPNDVFRQFGAEIVRLWVASTDASSDVAVSMDILKQVSESYRKIRNTMRFMLANVTDFDVEKDSLDFEQLREVDQYLLVRLNDVVKQSLEAYDQFDFATVFKLVNSFLVNDLSAFYLDFAKDVIYIDQENEPERRAMQTVIYESLVALTKLLTPILPHTAEEVWQYLSEPEDYVQLAEMPVAKDYPSQAQLRSQWVEFMNFRDDVHRALETARQEKIIGKSLEAAVTIYPSEQLQTLLTNLKADVAQLLIVSQLAISSDAAPADATSFDNFSIRVVHAPGEVCDRCRKTLTDVGSDADLPNLCASCAQIVRAEFPEVVTEGFDPKKA